MFQVENGFFYSSSSAYGISNSRWNHQVKLCAPREWKSFTREADRGHRFCALTKCAMDFYFAFNTELLAFGGIWHANRTWQIGIFSVSTVSNAQPLLFRSHLSGLWFANFCYLSYWISPRCLRRCHLFHFIIKISIRHTNSHHPKYIPEDGAKTTISDW